MAAVRTANAGGALAPVTAETERGGSMSDEREAQLTVESGVPLLADRFEGREVLPRKPPEESRLSWTVVRPGGQYDGCRGSRIHKG
jgi:hypothetical protein